MEWSLNSDWMGVLLLNLLIKEHLKKIGSLIRSRKFLFLKLFFISTNLPSVSAWNAVVTSGLVPRISPWIWWITWTNISIGHLVLPLLHLMNSSFKFSRIVFYRYYAGGCIKYSDRLHDILVTIPTFYKDSWTSSFLFLGTAVLWNSFPAWFF